MDKEGNSRSFEQILQEVESILSRLQESSVPLEEALSLYERGFKLLKDADERLGQARHKLEELKKGPVSDSPES